MIKSRCGIVCEPSKCKEAFGVDCPGCVAMEKPFWGTCDVKVCCEGKGLEHCGLCSDFPCEVLNRFAYDKEQGDDGKRIEQCREWAVASTKRYACYCGLYCEHCAVKAKVEPAARILYDEMKKAGFEEIINFIPGSDGFWPFLKSMAEDGICISCKEGSGNPGCAVRLCAQEKGVEMCAFCEDYPCDKFAAFLNASVGYSVLEQDNALLRDKGWDAWLELQAKRRAAGYSYSVESE